MSFLFLFTAFTIIYCIQKIICSSDEPDQNHFFCKSTVDMHRHDLDTQHFTWTEKKTIFSGLGICSLALRSFGQNPKNLRATMSDSLRSVLTKERPWANCSGCSYLKSDLERFARRNSEKWLFCMNSFPSFEPKSALLLSLFAHLLFFKEQPWAILFKKERLRDSLKKRVNHTFFSFAHTKKPNLLKKPMSEFPTLNFFL